VTQPLSRRTVLKGMGVTMALPWLEAFTRTAHAAGIAAGAPVPPVRMACVFMPNGVNYANWAPKGADAALNTLSPALEPLTALRSKFNIITGLTLDKARANGDGPGDHARSSASFLTGHQARKTAGNDIKLGVSVDQIAAREVGKESRLASLEIGCEHGPEAGNCDSGYSCAYTSNISWRDDTTPMPKLVDPKAVFERLFGDSANAAAQAERLARRRSILDYVGDQSKRLESRLGVRDRRKLDQFTTSVREIELRIARAGDESKEARQPDVDPPAGIPRKVSEHVDLMYDMLTLAFRMDVTRVATFMLGNDGSNRTFPEIGIKEGHHHLSHHRDNQEMIEKIRLIDRFYTERFARFLTNLSKAREGDGSLLDQCMVLYGGGISDGNRHDHDNLPIILAGNAGGSVNTGRLIRAPKETPLCNLYVSMLDRMGCGVPSFGDSRGPLTAL
jgi:hypothetical protein